MIASTPRLWLAAVVVWVAVGTGLALATFGPPSGETETLTKVPPAMSTGDGPAKTAGTADMKAGHP